MQICHSGFCLQKTGIYYLNHLLLIDSRLRGNDRRGCFFANYNYFIIECLKNRHEIFFLHFREIGLTLIIILIKSDQEG